MLFLNAKFKRFKNQELNLEMNAKNLSLEMNQRSESTNYDTLNI